MVVKGKSSPTANPAPTREIRSTPFKRGRSRVFYASEDNLPQYSTGGIKTSTLKTNLKEFSITNYESGNIESEPLLWRNTLNTCKETSEGSSSGDEAHSPSGSSIRSPIGSLRSSLGGSLRGSQDSGYSDSGESNSGCLPDADTIESPPRVKHISRVFFGGGSGRARLYSDTIVTTPINEPSDSINSLFRRQKSCSTQVGSLAGSCSSRSSPTSICELDEPQFQLENKSILDISSELYDEQASRETGAIRKASYVSVNKREPRRSKSADKLLDEPKAKKSCILKSKRRWSTIDSIINSNLHKNLPKQPENIERCLSLGTLHETSQKINSTARKVTSKKFRIHPTAHAAEMK